MIPLQIIRRPTILPSLKGERVDGWEIGWKEFPPLSAASIPAALAILQPRYPQIPRGDWAFILHSQ